MTKMQVLKSYFEGQGGRKVTMAEIQALSTEDRETLAHQAAVQLGVMLDVSAPALVPA